MYWAGEQHPHQTLKCLFIHIGLIFLPVDDSQYDETGKATIPKYLLARTAFKDELVF